MFVKEEGVNVFIAPKCMSFSNHLFVIQFIRISDSVTVLYDQHSHTKFPYSVLTHVLRRNTNRTHPFTIEKN